MRLNFFGFLLILFFNNSSASDLKVAVKKEIVKAQIKAMYEEDQSIRKSIGFLSEQGFSSEQVFEQPLFKKYFQKMDRRNTESLKKILAKINWPKISEYGGEIDQKTWLLVQHADHDKKFQKSILTKLDQLKDQNETLKSNYAYLYDRVQFNHNLPQKFGTQGKCESKGSWKAHLIEDVDSLEILRKDFGLVPFEEYQKTMNGYCKF